MGTDDSVGRDDAIYMMPLLRGHNYHRKIPINEMFAKTHTPQVINTVLYLSISHSVWTVFNVVFIVLAFQLPIFKLSFGVHKDVGR